MHTPPFLRDALTEARAQLSQLESLWGRVSELSFEELAAVRAWDPERVDAICQQKRALFTKIERDTPQRRRALTALWVASGLPLERAPSHLVDFAAFWMEHAAQEHEELGEDHVALGRQFDRLLAMGQSLNQLQERIKRALEQSLGWVDACLTEMTQPTQTSAYASRGLKTSGSAFVHTRA